MENARNSLNIVILDACRNNPFARSFRSTQKGLASIDAPGGTLIAYATAPGSVASDGAGRNGLYTQELLKYMKQPEVSIEQLFKQVRTSVRSRTEGKQIPWESSSLEGDFYFSSSTSVTNAAKNNTLPAFDPAAIELEFWNSIKTSTDTDDFKEYLAQYPAGKFGGLARNKIRALESAAKSEAARPKTESKPTATDPKPVGTSSSPGGLGALPLRGFEFDVVTVNSSGSETSRRKGQAQYCSEDIAGISLELVPIPGGTFTMGSSSGETDRAPAEGPQHQVSVQPFYMGKYEVTQAQWRAVAGLPKVARDLKCDPSNFKGDNLPVEQVSWEDAVEFCARLSRATGRTYRLPTEAEWEYACRGSTTTPFAFGQTVTAQLVNYNGNYPYAQAPKGTYRETTTPVGFMGVANGFGLFDMHGNVWEWCLDYWHESYNGAPTDGTSWETAGDTRYRVLRGGSWSSLGSYCRSANRYWGTPDNRSLNVGFRIVGVGRTR